MSKYWRRAMNSLFSTFSRMAIGRHYVFMPMGKLFRSKRVVRCPEFDQPAEITVDAAPSRSSKPRKKLFSIRNCSLWPKRKGCTQSCEK
jgi:hypothetical protein